MITLSESGQTPSIQLPSVTPFLKWAGGKIRLFNYIRQQMPVSITRYVEPFVGAGSIALNVNAQETIINDINEDLILVWTMVRDHPEQLIGECKPLFSYSDFQTPEGYYKLRTAFNVAPLGIYRAALFLYLNRHCFNGLCRYNSKGEFNVPVGKYKTIKFPENEIREISKLIQKWNISCEDFQRMMAALKEGDVCYCDPPYCPLSKTAYFKDYAKEGFTIEQHEALAKAAYDASLKGAIVLVSNHSTEFTNDLYRKYGAEIHVVEASRAIAVRSKNKKTATELIAVFKPTTKL